MKKFLLIITLLSTVPSAFAFFVNARCHVNSTVATCIVNNQWNRPIRCHGNATALATNGQTGHANFFGTLYPGQYSYIYVRSYEPYTRFVSAWANIDCSWYNNPY